MTVTGRSRTFSGAVQEVAEEYALDVGCPLNLSRDGLRIGVKRGCSTAHCRLLKGEESEDLVENSKTADFTQGVFVLGTESLCLKSRAKLPRSCIVTGGNYSKWLTNESN
jgi:hypothetical protein